MDFKAAHFLFFLGGGGGKQAVFHASYNGIQACLASARAASLWTFTEFYDNALEVKSRLFLESLPFGLIFLKYALLCQ